MSAFILALMLAFQVPVYHVAIIKDGHQLFSIEDLTKKECRARLKTFKKSDHATCVLENGERELA